MQPYSSNEVLAKICHHRGIGQENSLKSISTAIAVSPFLVEFDVQWSDDELRLGHPPELSEPTLDQALLLFEGTDILPKIDLKLTEDSYEHGLGALVNILNVWAPRKALINIAGDLSAGRYMQGEKILMNKTGANVLLNIDLDRYKPNNQKTIIAHVKDLSRTPFSISPNLADDAHEAIKFASSLGIPHVHFWSTFNARHPIQNLHERMVLCQKNGLEVYFDIKSSNVSQN